MLSSRTHNECWKLEKWLNLLFFWHYKHCERAHRWERRHAQTNQVATQPSQEAATDYETSPSILAALPEEVSMSAEWEYDFSPNPNTNVCEECGQVHIAEASIVQKVWFIDVEIALNFCSTKCRQEYYLSRLREGM